MEGGNILTPFQKSISRVCRELICTPTCLRQAVLQFFTRGLSPQPSRDWDSNSILPSDNKETWWGGVKKGTSAFHFLHPCHVLAGAGPSHSPSISMTENDVCVRAHQHFTSSNPWCQGSPVENHTSIPSSQHDQMQWCESGLVCTQVPIPLPPSEQGLVGRWAEPPSLVLDWGVWCEEGLVSIPPPSSLPCEVNPVGSWASSYTWHLWGRIRWQGKDSWSSTTLFPGVSRDQQEAEFPPP